MNKNPTITLAGIWQFAAGQTDIVTFYSQIKLGTNKMSGLVLAGWAYSGFSNANNFFTTNIAVLDQSSDGTLKLDTSRYTANSSINGAGSVIVTDLNRDGVDDIFLAAHNESPNISKSSTAYLSTAVDQFSKIEIADSTQSHSAVLAEFNGVPTIVTSGYGTADPYYQFNSSTKNVNVLKWGNTYSGSLYGSAAITVDLDNDGRSELVIADFKSGPGYDYNANAPTALVAYSIVDNKLGNAPTILGNGYFTQNTQYPGVSTHMYRVWTDDFNHDGKSDLLLGVGIWSEASSWQGSKLQMLQNNGGLNFVDVTNQLGSTYSTSSNNVDYSTQQIDLDGSGIKSYSLGEAFTTLTTNNCNYLLLNDGTGKLYTALHDEFLVLGAGVRQFLDLRGISYNKAFIAPKFLAYQLEDGSINYVAQYVSSGNDQIPLVNVPMHYNITTDFSQNINIANRNNSMLMRTWAGNDTFHDSGANVAAAHLDGGLGLNTSIYSDSASSYTIRSLNAGSYKVKHVITSAAPNVDDALVNIQRLKFTDTNVALDVGPTQNAGSVYMIYKAAFNRAPDASGMGYWLAQKDAGSNIVTNIAQGFVNSAEFTAKYGTNPSNATYIDKLYQNVLGRSGDAGGVTYWNQQLDNGSVSKAAALAAFATLPEGASNVASLIANGIPYTEFVG